jgi:hypothetical protein
MMIDGCRWGAGLVLVLGCWLLTGDRPRAADDKPPAVPLGDTDFDRLVEQTHKTIQDSLKGKPDDLAAEKARTAAIVLAAIAQYSQDAKTASRRREVREVALKVAAALKDDKFDQARADAATLTKPPAAAKAAALVPLIDQQISLKDVMHHYSGGRGGTGGEKKLDALADNAQARKTGALPAKELNDELILLALRSATIGELVKDHSDDKVKKAPDLWKKYAEDMRKQGLELAGAVRAKDGKAAWNALNNLNGSCSACHKKFER